MPHCLAPAVNPTVRGRYSTFPSLCPACQDKTVRKTNRRQLAANFCYSSGNAKCSRSDLLSPIGPAAKGLYAGVIMCGLDTRQPTQAVATSFEESAVIPALAREALTIPRRVNTTTSRWSRPSRSGPTTCTPAIRTIAVAPPRPARNNLVRIQPCVL